MWTTVDDQRVRALVQHAHAEHLGIRFYTLDGQPTGISAAMAGFGSYDFSSLERVRVRRRTAYTAGVDYIAIDQYEHLAAYLNEPRSTIQRSQGPNTGERFRQGNLSPSTHDCGTRRTR